MNQTNHKAQLPASCEREQTDQLQLLRIGLSDSARTNNGLSVTDPAKVRVDFN